MDDDEAWDKLVNRRISELNRKVESVSRGDALAALHGLHVPSHDDPPCDVDATADTDNQKILRDKIVTRLVQIEGAISRHSGLSGDVKRKWIATLQQCSCSEPNSETLLRDLRRELETWQEIDPESMLSLLDGAIGAVTRMIEIYRRRFYSG